MEFSLPKLIKPKTFIVIFVMAILFIIPVLIRNDYYNHILIMVFFYATLAGAWNVLGGFAGQISIGHTAFFGIGAYTSTLLYLHYGMSPWIGMLIGGFLASLVAGAIGYPTFRLRGHFFALSTIAFAEVMYILASYLRGITKGGVGLLIPFEPKFTNFIFQDKIYYFYISLLLMLATVYVSYLFLHSKLGFYSRALSELEDAAETLGISTTRVKLIAMMISSFFTGVAGSFFAQYLLFIDPTNCFSLSLSIEIGLIAIIGGLGTIFGPVIGAFILVPMDTGLRVLSGVKFAGLDFLIYGIVLIIVVIIMPEGVMKWLQPRKKKFQVLQYTSSKKVSKLDIHSLLPEAPCSFNGANFLEIVNLNKSFGGLHAVRDLNLEIKKGEIVGLIGPNGAGKTTVLNLISGLLIPDSGIIKFKGDLVTDLPAHAISLMGIGKTFQIVKVFQKMTVEDNLTVAGFSSSKNMKEINEKAHEILKMLDLEHLKQELAGNISGGQQKLLEFGRVLMLNPELYLLDEPFVGVHPEICAQIYGLIEEIHSLGKTFVIISHDMKSIFALCSRLVVFSSGNKIAEGDPEIIRHDERVLEAYLGE